MWEPIDTRLAKEYLSRDKWRVPFLERAVAEIERLTERAGSDAEEVEHLKHRLHKNHERVRSLLRENEALHARLAAVEKSPGVQRLQEAEKALAEAREVMAWLEKAHDRLFQTIVQRARAARLEKALLGIDVDEPPF